MSSYLNTRGKSSLAIAVCDRCHFKVAWSDLVQDPNTPGLRVHQHCADQFDPYRLPARQTEIITMPWARPDESLATNPSGLISEDGNMFITTEDSNEYLVP